MSAISAEGLVSVQDQGPFQLRSIWEMTGLKSVATLPGLHDLGSNDMLMGFSPHTVCSGRLMCLTVVLYRICVSVLWERCNELMLETCKLLWVFFFSFQALLLTSLLGSFVFELLCIPAEIRLASSPLLFDPIFRTSCYYSSCGSLNYLLFHMSHNYTEGAELLESIIFKN